MKRALIAAASMVGIIAVRMILSVAFSEQVANVFTGVSIGFLFYYSILSHCKSKPKSAN
ncbi:MAG: hypothetical protein K2J99_11965 [Lachnospiraceae bacterium]|nr:hypothetical protein [Lachnospiraceae bacterium]